MVIAFSVIFLIGKSGKAAISPWITSVPSRRFSASMPSSTGATPAPAVQSSTTSTPWPPVIAMIRVERVLVLDVDDVVGAERLGELQPGASRLVPVTMMSDAPACLQATTWESPCWPGPWISTVES